MTFKQFNQYSLGLKGRHFEFGEACFILMRWLAREEERVAYRNEAAHWSHNTGFTAKRANHQLKGP